MKKFLLSLAAASTLVALPAAAGAADFSRNDRGRVEQRDSRSDNAPRYQAQRQGSERYRDFRQGDRFDSRQARNYRQIGNPRAYGLSAAPQGQRWVQSGNDALLVGIASGVVAAVLANAF